MHCVLELFANKCFLTTVNWSIITVRVPLPKRDTNETNGDTWVRYVGQYADHF
jgi:hypothetical protein